MEKQLQQQAVVSKLLLTVSFLSFSYRTRCHLTTGAEEKNGKHQVALLCDVEITESEEAMLQLSSVCVLSSHQIGVR